MKFRNTILLLVVLCALCAGYYGMLQYQEGKRHHAEESKRLFTFAPEDVHTFTIKQKGSPAVVGELGEGGVWRITAPYALKAYQPIWTRVVKAFAELTRERTIDSKDLTAFELDEPPLTVSAGLASGETVEASFGAVAAIPTNHYARVGDGPIILVPENSFFEINRALDVLREFHLFDTGNGPVARIEFAWIRPNKQDGSPEESTPVTVELQDNGRYHLVKPEEGPVNMDRLGRFIVELGTEACKGFVDAPESLADYGLDPPNARVSLWTQKDGPAQTVYFGAKQGKGDDARMYAKNAKDPAVFTVNAQLAALFPASPDSFRERRLFTRDAAKLRQFHYQSRESDFTMEREATGPWHFTNSADGVVDQAAAAQFLNAVTRVQAKDFAPGVSVDPAHATATLTFTTQDSGEPSVIRIGSKAADGESYYAVQDIGIPVLLDGKSADGLIHLTPFDFQTRDMLVFKPDDAAKVELRFDGVDYVFERPATLWRVSLPEKKAWTSQDDMKALLEALAAVKAVGQTATQAPADLAPYGLDAPLASATVTVKDAQGERTLPLLRIGGVLPNDEHQRFATLEGRPEVFRVRQSAIDDMRKALGGVRDQ